MEGRGGCSIFSPFGNKIIPDIWVHFVENFEEYLIEKEKNYSFL